LVEGGFRVQVRRAVIGGVGRVTPIHDDQLARQRLVALLDPDLPVDLALAESVVVGLHAIERVGADQEAGLQRVGARAAARAPAKQVVQRQRDAELVRSSAIVAVRRGRRPGRVIPELRRIEGELGAVVE
jgi:hypothetical protein